MPKVFSFTSSFQNPPISISESVFFPRLKVGNVFFTHFLLSKKEKLTEEPAAEGPGIRRREEDGQDRWRLYMGKNSFFIW